MKGVKIGDSTHPIRRKNAFGIDFLEFLLNNAVDIYFSS